MSRAPKQLSAEQIAERAERVYAIESVTALAQAPEQALRYYTQLTDVKLRSAMEPAVGVFTLRSLEGDSSCARCRSSARFFPDE